MSQRRFAYLFPGQASQYPGMGLDLAQSFPESREVFQVADRVLGRSISDLCFTGTAEALALTENTQPTVLAVSVAALRPLQAQGLRPAAAAGHSLGEYAAHVAAGTLPFEDALRTVELRARFMQEAVPVGTGAMSAVLGLDLAHVREACREAATDSETVCPANLNAPNQIVIAGHAAAVGRAGAAALRAGARRVVALSVSAPFHCPLMLPAAERLRPVLAGLEFHAPQFPVFSNVDATPVEDAEAARDGLVRQVASPVRWDESIRAMLGTGIGIFVEVGPGTALAGLLRSIDREARVLPAGDAQGVREVLRELAA